MPGKPGIPGAAVFVAVGLAGNPGSAIPGSICKRTMINYQLAMLLAEFDELSDIGDVTCIYQ